MDYIVRLADMPCKVKGFVKNDDDFCTIVINSRLSADEQRKTYEHEAHHVRCDMGKDASADEIEKTARKG